MKKNVLRAAPTPTITDAMYNVATYGYMIEAMKTLKTNDE